ncbi:hypothetical protein RO3G_01741 [Lichtheimia corymbifera JMRC:FSU:9682]|uniref:Integrase catalytic domain-containing protein n=1 Tax=Lichtheimia corymbifera JMRC:FSU:9682 TaxID=1263082 RepID=A0A068SII2_9FUNG|nr:hypothetical protein RO3G_01741 [Lichtheimia corymbifera JMRC:FSU:9682]
MHLYYHTLYHIKTLQHFIQASFQPSIYHFKQHTFKLSIHKLSSSATFSQDYKQRRMDYPRYLAIYYLLTENRYPMDCDNEYKTKLRNTARMYMAAEGKLFKRMKDGSQGLEVLHEGNADDAIRRVHEEGHLGINNTLKRLRLKYEGRGVIRTEKARPIDTPERPLFTIGCDAVGPFGKEATAQGNRYILVAVDYLTRWSVARAVPDITETTTAEFLNEQVVVNYGVPNYILTDRGSNFTSGYVREFLKSIGCKHITTTAYRPQVNGLCERMNGTITSALAKIARDQDDVKEWDKYVTTAVLAARTMVNESTRYSPAMLLYGYELRIPAIWLAPREDYMEGELHLEMASRIKVIQHLVDQARLEARERTKEQQRKAKLRYDAHVQESPRFIAGDMVLMRDQRPAGKLDDRWIGPMTVVKANSGGTYYLHGPNQQRLKGAVHGDNLVSWVARTSMIPDVMVQRADQQFRAWLARRGAQ